MSEWWGVLRIVQGMYIYLNIASYVSLEVSKIPCCIMKTQVLILYKIITYVQAEELN